MKVVQNSENKSEMLVLFFSRSSYLSNFYKSTFTVHGIKFTSMEQFFHYSKAFIFKDYASMQSILRTDEPNRQKAIGRKVKNYDDSTWSDKCYMIMIEGLYAKFSQNDTLKKKLLSIPNARFVEASPYDKKWGIGLNINHRDVSKPSKWPGQNMLGEALMEVRDDLNVKQSTS
jgi:ribA/ribD-fused uncharacterized protein